MSKWIEAPSFVRQDGLGQIAAHHPLAACLLAQRGIRTEREAAAFLDPDAYPSSSPFDLPGMEEGIERLTRAVERGERIGVWGDFDVDGLTATATLVGALRAAGTDVTYHIPVRARSSHGVHRPALEALVQGGIRLLLTCDTGIDAYDQTVYAQDQGVDVIISDHHSLPERLPPALAVINPHLLAQDHPFITLPGAGVAYEIVEALARFGVAGFAPQDFHDLIALATVADVMPVLGEARWLLQRGLQTLRASPRPALQAIFDLNELDHTHITEEHIAYLLAPRINAVGRLDDASSLVDFFLSDDAAIIKPLAVQMEALNARRRLLSQEVFDSAMMLIERNPTLLDAPLLVLAHKDWQPGVIGIVASRLVQTLGRPAVLISIDSESGSGRGSARSVPGIDIAAAISRQAHLLNSHGGHPAAAGLSISAEKIEDFRRGMARTVGEMVSGRDIEPPLTINGYLTLSDLDLDLAGEVEMLAPFGPGNPAPVFASQYLNVVSATPIGRGQEHLKMRVEDGRGNVQDVFWWQGVGQPMPIAPFDLAYNLRTNTYQGQRGLQLTWIEARPSHTGQIHIPDAGRLPFEIIDLRRQNDPLSILDELLTTQASNVQIWCEGEACNSLSSKGIEYKRRNNLQAAHVLVIWSPPPARDVLQAAIAVVKPQTIYLFSIRLRAPDANQFLIQLAGYIKNALRTKEGKIDLTVMAALTSETEEAVRLGIEWLAARGDIAFSVIEKTNEIAITIPEEMRVDHATAARLQKRIDAALAESAAYSDFFLRADAGVLF